MEYAKIQGAFVRGVVFREADMAARGAWATLVAFCADQENGGRIIGCTAWTDRQWLSRADCLRADVDHLTRSKLAAWGGEDLLIAGYDQVSEASFRTLAETNRRRALDGWQKRRGNAGGTGDESRRQSDEMPGAMPAAPAPAAAAMPAAPVADAIDRPTDRPTLPLPQDQFEEEGEDATAATTADAWQPTEAEARSLAWVNAAGLPWELPGGADLRREWIAALRHLSRKEADAVRRRMAGDTPSAFRNAMGAELTEARRARAASAAEPPAVAAPTERVDDTAAAAERDAQRAAAHGATPRHQQLLVEEEPRERGAYLEQAQALLDEIARADPRRLVLADGGWASALVRLRNAAAAGRVPSIDLVFVRCGWPGVRDRALPAAPTAPPPPPPEPPRDFTEPVEADPEPATP